MEDILVRYIIYCSNEHRLGDVLVAEIIESTIEGYFNRNTMGALEMIAKTQNK